MLHNQNIYGTIKDIIDYHRNFIKCKEPYERIIKILDTKIDIQKNKLTCEIEGYISFNNIDFKYEKAETNTLTNFNFKIGAGEKIAIIGSSGCGKSTLAKLLIGILSPIKGSICIDGIDINDYDNEWLKNKIGYVSQDSILFSDTIANNISYGLNNASIDDIIIASKQANAHEFISKLPNQYLTKLEGTELSSLSGGQKQRICIARALIRKPKILIFDEATSALDPYCEELVQNTIKECYEKQNTTIIIIAHKRSALNIVDKIYILENSELKSIVI
jgi:ABC-type bacteriocin/lantibiotic exporter with double-glycine peptidase domain